MVLVLDFIGKIIQGKFLTIYRFRDDFSRSLFISLRTSSNFSFSYLGREGREIQCLKIDLKGQISDKKSCLTIE